VNVAAAVKIGPFAPEGIVDLIEQQVLPGFSP
jgi:hypothetical protein